MAAGQLTLRQSAALIARAAVLVTNDSAPLHLATAWLPDADMTDWLRTFTSRTLVWHLAGTAVVFGLDLVFSKSILNILGG